VSPSTTRLHSNPAESGNAAGLEKPGSGLGEGGGVANGWVGSGAAAAVCSGLVVGDAGISGETIVGVSGEKVGKGVMGGSDAPNSASKPQPARINVRKKYSIEINIFIITINSKFIQTRESRVTNAP
jgi:hypothetical protein